MTLQPKGEGRGLPFAFRLPWFLQRRRYLMYSLLAPEQCHARLLAATTPTTRVLARGRTLFRGNVRPGAFEVKRETEYGSSFLPEAVGKLTLGQGGTEIDIDVGIPVEIVMIVTGAMLLLLVGEIASWATIFLNLDHVSARDLLFPLAFAILLVVGVVFMSMGRKWLSEQELWLLDKLKSTLNARA